MTRFGRPTRIPVLFIGIVALVAACGGSGATAAPATPVPSGVVAIEASDQGGYKFTPASLTVPAGSVTFSFKNAGSENHELQIVQGDTVAGKVDGIAAGATQDLAVTLEAGQYEYVCTINGHDLAGMKGTLTVQ